MKKRNRPKVGFMLHEMKPITVVEGVKGNWTESDFYHPDVDLRHAYGTGSTMNPKLKERYRMAVYDWLKENGFDASTLKTRKPSKRKLGKKIKPEEGQIDMFTGEIYQGD